VATPATSGGAAHTAAAGGIAADLPLLSPGADDSETEVFNLNLLSSLGFAGTAEAAADGRVGSEGARGNRSCANSDASDNDTAAGSKEAPPGDGDDDDTKSCVKRASAKLSESTAAIPEVAATTTRPKPPAIRLQPPHLTLTLLAMGLCSLRQCVSKAW